MNKNITNIFLQDYVKRFWNHSNTKIPVTIGKGTDTAKPRSKAPQGGAMMHRNTIPGSCLSHRFIMYLTYKMFHHFHLGNIHFRFTVITVLCICHFSLFSKSKQSWGFIYEIYHILLSNLSVDIVNSLKPEKAVQLLADDHFKPMMNQFNSLWHSDAIWWHRSRSTLVQLMACCLTAPSHYLNQCWLIIIKVQWCSSEGNFAWDSIALSY